MVKRKGTRRPLVIGLFFLVATAFFAAATLGAISSRSDVADWTSDQAAIVEQVMQEAVDAVVADAQAVAAFVEEVEPSAEQFQSYVHRLEGADNAVGVGYITSVPADSIEDFVGSRREIHGDWYEIFEFPSGEGAHAADLTSRDTFYPVEAFAVGEEILALAGDEPIVERLGIGLDAGSDPAWGIGIADAMTGNTPTVSKFIDINVDDVLVLDRVFIVSAPVRDESGSTRGLVVAMMLEPLLVSELTTPALQQVDWELVAPGGSPRRVTSEYARILPIELPGTEWSLAIAPTLEALSDLQGLSSWMVGLIAAALVFLIALTLWLLFERRAEHRRVTQYQRIADDKDRFLASVSHELRTPLTVVSGLAYELHEQPDNFDEAERDGLMGMLVEQTDELSGIVEDLLVAARSDIGKVTIHCETVDLGEESKRAMETSGIDGTFRGQPGHAYADAQRVRQILRNLLTNAKRYGGPKVRIDFADGAGWTEVVVADNGDGVPRHKREAIFQSYESAHEPSNEVRSVGLGLYISRNLAQAMGGDLEYVYDGTWSHFRLRLPSAPVAAQAIPRDDQEDRDSDTAAIA